MVHWVPHGTFISAWYVGLAYGTLGSTWYTLGGTLGSTWCIE